MCSLYKINWLSLWINADALTRLLGVVPGPGELPQPPVMQCTWINPWARSCMRTEIPRLWAPPPSGRGRSAVYDRLQALGGLRWMFFHTPPRPERETPGQDNGHITADGQNRVGGGSNEVTFPAPSSLRFATQNARPLLPPSLYMCALRVPAHLAGPATPPLCS